MNLNEAIGGTYTLTQNGIESDPIPYDGYWICHDCLTIDVETLTIGRIGGPIPCCICGRNQLPKDIVCVSLPVLQKAGFRVHKLSHL